VQNRVGCECFKPAWSRRSIILESSHLNDRCTFGTCRKGNSHYSAIEDIHERQL
jgi:hypothetical protein